MDNNAWLPQIDQNTCIGCGDCVAKCPTHALATVNHKATLAHPHLCIYCDLCEDICPTASIQLPLLIARSTATP